MGPDLETMAQERVIYKYELNRHSEYTEYIVPANHKFLTAQVQVQIEAHQGAVTNKICVWVEVDPNSRRSHVVFRIVGTGGHFDAEGWEYIDTVQVERFVWHIYASLE